VRGGFDTKVLQQVIVCIGAGLSLPAEDGDPDHRAREATHMRERFERNVSAGPQFRDVLNPTLRADHKSRASCQEPEYFDTP
jgi:hypothetical protein